MKKINYKKISKINNKSTNTSFKKIKKSIGSSFNQAVKAIGDCKSKIYFVGVGKSGHLANLIAASLSSVGASSFALTQHQMLLMEILGQYHHHKKDVLILISNSGSSKN